MHLIRLINLHLEFIPAGIRYRLIVFLCNLLKFNNSNFTTTFYGMTYEGNTKNHIDFMVYFFGAYEKGILNCVKRFLTKDSIVFDVGANIGHHSLFFSTCSQQVYAFEPYTPVRNELDRKIALNGIKSITVVPLGLSQIEESLGYFEPPSHNLGAGSFIKEHSLENTDVGLQLRLVKGDDFVLANKIARLDLIKIDVEGFEYNVLAGLKESISRLRPVVVLELNKDMLSRFNSEKDFIDFFPPNYSFFNFSNQFSPMAKLVEFRLKKSGSTNLICIPNERS